MNADIDVRQISSDAYHPTAYLNVEHKYGYISVWSSHNEKITILAFVGEVTFQLFQFESYAYYSEWLEESEKVFNKIINIEDLK